MTIGYGDIHYRMRGNREAKGKSKGRNDYCYHVRQRVKLNEYSLAVRKYS